MNHEQKCYGKMFPSVVEMAYDGTIMGKVFGYQMDYAGQVAQTREPLVDRDAWEKCLECRELDGCFQLSVGTMLMELAVKTSPKSLFQG